MPEPFDPWDIPPLSAEDQVLVDEYRRLGISSDDLPYTPEFDALRSAVGLPDNEDGRRGLWRRLLRLRKMGRLPRTPLVPPARRNS
jgi:hypothetical protein